MSLSPLDRFRQEFAFELGKKGVPLDMSLWTRDQAKQAELIRLAISMEYGAIVSVTLAGALGK